MIIVALKEITPTKDNWFSFALSLILGIILAIKIGIAENTIELLLPIIEKILEIYLAIFGILFTVYSIILAFLNDSYIEKLSQIDDDDGSSYLKSSTTYYESVLFLYFITLGVTGILLLFLYCLDRNYVLTSSLLINNMLAILLLFFYFTLIIRVFYELKSTIYNTIELFRKSVAYKLLSLAKKEGD